MIAEPEIIHKPVLVLEARPIIEVRAIVKIVEILVEEG